MTPGAGAAKATARTQAKATYNLDWDYVSFLLYGSALMGIAELIRIESLTNLNILIGGVFGFLSRTRDDVDH